MRKVTIKETSYGTWAASSDLAAIDLAREGLITQVKIQIYGVAAAGLTAFRVDGLPAMLENLKIEGDGGRTYLGLSGQQTGRLLYFMNLFDFGTPPITTLSGTGEYCTLIFHPGSNPKDQFDLTAAIPARALSSLQVKVTTTAAADVLDDTNDIQTTSRFFYEIDEVLDAPVTAGLMTPLGSTFSWVQDAAYSDYSKEIDVPAGAWLRRIVILNQDDSATVPVRADDEVSGVKLKLPKMATSIIESSWEQLKASTAIGSNYVGLPMAVTDDVGGVLCLPDGVAIIDLRKYGHPLYGLNLTDYQTGDVKLGLTVETPTSGDDTLIYWDQLKPVESQYVGK